MCLLILIERKKGFDKLNNGLFSESKRWFYVFFFSGICKDLKI